MQTFFFFSNKKMVNRNVYKASRGRKLHMYNCCDLKKCKTSIHCYDKDDVSGVLCSKCFGECMICLTEPGWKTCDAHALCDSCLQTYVENCGYFFDFSCPCGKKGLDPRDFPYKILMMLYNFREKNVTKTSVIDEYAQILNEKCPGCDKVFCDFDACAALYCRCGTYFCGFCFEVEESMTSAHEHVKKCPKNPYPGELFIDLESWKNIRAQLKKKECVQFYKKKAENGIVDYMYYWIKLLPFNSYADNIFYILCCGSLLFPFLFISLIVLYFLYLWQC